MTLDVVALQDEDGTWFARCVQHPAWRCAAPTYDELREKAPTQLKRHHSRLLGFRWNVYMGKGIV